MFRHILFPTDGSPLSARAAKYAVKVAKAGNARITALHVIPRVTAGDFTDAGPIYPDLSLPQLFRRNNHAYAKELLGKVEAIAKQAKVECDTVIATGLPWQAIIESAKANDCDLIVMASHGRRGLQAVLLGSETTKVLTHSKTPVLVCR